MDCFATLAMTPFRHCEERSDVAIHIHGGFMKALFIGGTGTISLAISKLLLEKGWELYLINRGNRNTDPRLKGAHFITVSSVYKIKLPAFFQQQF